MSEPNANATLEVAMSCFPSERMVSAVSRLVSEFCGGLVRDQEIADRFHMAAQELAENLVKYSSGDEMSLSARLATRGPEAVLELVAKNHSSPHQLQAVEAHLNQLRSASDPVELYDRLIRESAPDSEGSGLGLARIRAEGEFEVDYRIEGTELTISVRAAVHAQSP